MSFLVEESLTISTIRSGAPSSSTNRSGLPPAAGTSRTRPASMASSETATTSGSTDRLPASEETRVSPAKRWTPRSVASGHSRAIRAVFSVPCVKMSSGDISTSIWDATQSIRPVVGKSSERAQRRNAASVARSPGMRHWSSTSTVAMDRSRQANSWDQRRQPSDLLYMRQKSRSSRSREGAEGPPADRLAGSHDRHDGLGVGADCPDLVAGTFSPPCLGLGPRG